MSLERVHILLDEISSNALSDLHLTTWLVPFIRQWDGTMVRVESFGVLSAELMREIASYILPADRRWAWPTEKELDASFTHNGSRFRVNAYYETRWASFAIRRIAEQIPTPETLGLPKAFIDLASRTQWLILVTGSTGSGKSTTLAALVDYINQTRAVHIITIEDPIEYVFESKKSLIHQREISTHTQSFPRAIKSALREDPDVVVIGEMRDPETMAAAITLAETGHLVISTLHTNDTVQAIDRIVDSFPTGAQSQIRVQLALSLAGILSQSLLLKLKGTGRIAARELLISNDAIRSLIVRGLTHQIYSMIELGASDGMVLMDRSLESLYLSRAISYDTFASRVRDRDILNLHTRSPWT